MIKQTNYCLAFMFAALLMGSCNSGTSSDPETKVDETATVTDDGFEPIFDGKTLNGWKGDSIHWRVEDGSLVGEITPSTTIQKNTFMIWQGGQPKDFELKLDFKITESGNSGINYRSEMFEDVPFALKGYQADIDGKNSYTGQNYEERGRTTLAYRGQKPLYPQRRVLRKTMRGTPW
ncbi:MAG TPA: DUF1080 domain-containing protein [Agriterribacter sp.]|nr:DUF1080 domain-containing protein [Agriterribacter sp.]